MRKAILSICDYSGHWPKPYEDAGYLIVRVDPKLKHGVFDNVITYPFTSRQFRRTVENGGFQRYLEEHHDAYVHGVLAAPPCTHFANSGAQYWKRKDKNGQTDQALSIVDDCIHIVSLLSPVFWCLENPRGRLTSLRGSLIGEPLMEFQPHHYAGYADNPDTDRYTKLTCLWGKFNHRLIKRDFKPVMYETRDGKQGSWMWAKLGGNTELTKTLRSNTPQGFARAFFRVNP